MFLSGTVPPRSFPFFARFPSYLSTLPSSFFVLFIYICTMPYTDGFSVRAVHYRLVRISFVSSIFFSLPDTCCSPSSLSLFFSTYPASLAFRPRSAPLSSSFFLRFFSSYPAVFEVDTYAASSHVLTRVSRKKFPSRSADKCAVGCHYNPAAISGSSRSKYPAISYDPTYIEKEREIPLHHEFFREYRR